MFLSIIQNGCSAKFVLKVIFALNLWVVVLDLVACENTYPTNDNKRLNKILKQFFEVNEEQHEIFTVLFINAMLCLKEQLDLSLTAQY